MQKNSLYNFKKRNFAVTLVEIAVAILFFAFAAIPIYYALSYGASQETDMEKVSIANSILSSFKDEVKNMPYKEVEGLYKPMAAWKTIGADLPNSFDKLLKAQKKYKDFKFIGQVRLAKDCPIDAMEFKAEITWSNPKGPKRKEKIAFIKVKK